MSRWHLTDDQLIDRLYGIRRSSDEHLEACAECASRWEALQEQRGQMVGEVPEGAAPWSEQRRQVLERIESGSGVAWSWQRAWAPALLTAVVLAVGVYFFRPVAPPPPNATAVSVDTTVPGWFEETYSEMQPDEPRAASAIRVLFEQPEDKVTEKVTE